MLPPLIKMGKIINQKRNRLNPLQFRFCWYSTRSRSIDKVYKKGRQRQEGKRGTCIVSPGGKVSYAYVCVSLRIVCENDRSQSKSERTRTQPTSIILIKGNTTFRLTVHNQAGNKQW